MRLLHPSTDRTPRRAIVAALGAFLTLVAVVLVHQPRGVYWSETNVFFLVPPDDRHVNTYAFTTDSVIATAGLVGHLVAPDDPNSGTGSQATLLALGVRHGTQVRLPNSGGQWDLNFDKPLLDVQVVGTSPEEVSERTTQLLDRIQKTLDKVQKGVASLSRIDLALEPSEVHVRYSEGDPHRAMAGTLMVGGLVTTMLVFWTGRRRRPRTTAPGAAVASTGATVLDDLDDLVHPPTDDHRRLPVAVS